MQMYFRLSTKLGFLDAKDKILAALATIPVAISNRLTLYLTKFHGWTITESVGKMFGRYVRS